MRRFSPRRIPRELKVRQAHVFNHDLIGSDAGRRLKIWHATGTTGATGRIYCSSGDEVVLVDAISADSKTANEHAIAVERQASGEKDDSAHVVGVGHSRFRSLRARVHCVVQKYLKKWPIARPIDSWRK